jgi:hypothetical protein
MAQEQQQQTRHPLASRTLAELQDIANAAEANNQTLFAKDWTPFDWLCLVQFVLTIRKQNPWSDEAIGQIVSTNQISKTPQY